MRPIPYRLLPLLLAASTTLGPLERGAALPPLAGERLDGRACELPADARGKVTLVAFGFTRGSSKAVQAWGGRFRGTFAADTSYDWFEVPLMGGMARIARGFIVGAMRGGTPEADRAHVVPVWSGCGEWRDRLEYREGEWAYLVLLDRAGRVRWRAAGKFDEATWRELESAARSIP